MVANSSKEVHAKLAKGLLDLIILQLLENHPTHGYQIITKIRKTFGVYFGPSTIYPLLGKLEKNGFLESKWDMYAERPRKIYRLTAEGRNLLEFTESSLNLICQKIGTTRFSSNALAEKNPTNESNTKALFITHNAISS